MHLIQKQELRALHGNVYNLLQDSARKKALDAFLVGNEHDLVASVGVILSMGLDYVADFWTQICYFYKLAKPNVSSGRAVILAHARHGEIEKVVDLYGRMRENGVGSNKAIYKSVLKACGETGTLSQFKQVHAHIIRCGLESDVIIGSMLIDMYVKYRSLEDACQVLNGLPNRNVVSWCAVIAGYANNGHGFSAVKLFMKMEQENIEPDKITFVCVLKACGSVGLSEQGKLIHKRVVGGGYDSDVVIGTTLVDMYCKCAHLEDGRKLFDRLTNRNVFTWGAMMSGYVQHGYGTPTLQLFKKMREEDIQPNKCIYSCMLKACGSTRAMEQGKLMHEQTAKLGLESDLVLGCTLIDMYAKCGILEEAQKVFDGLQHQTIVSWGAMITGYLYYGNGLAALQLFERLIGEGLKPNQTIVSCILKACSIIGALERGRNMHGIIIMSGFEMDAVLGSAIIDMYACCGIMEEACKTFKLMRIRNEVSWSLMIAGYVQDGSFQHALDHFKKMQQDGIKPNLGAVLYALKACGKMGDLNQGRLVHIHAVRTGMGSDMVLGTGLIDMYAKCSSLEDAHEVFDELPAQDATSVCTMIAGYVNDGHGFWALDLFQKMHEDGIKPDKVLFSCILKACSTINAIVQGMLIHDQIMGSELESDLCIENALIDMYAKCGSLKEAQNMFDGLLNRDLVSWATIIAGYTQYGQALCALQLFEQMVHEDLQPDQVILLCVLQACGILGATWQAKWMHDRVIRERYEADVVIGNALIDMYAKSRDIKEAYAVFDRLHNRDTISWSAMIAGFVQNDDGLSALECFSKMQWQGIKPNAVVLLSILMACSNTGALCQGKLIHDQIMKWGLDSNIHFGNTVMDMYAKCGSLEEAHKVFENMPSPDPVSFSILIAGYGHHGHYRLALQCLEQVRDQGLELHPVMYTIVLSFCSHAGLLEEGLTCLKSMKEEDGIAPNTQHFVSTSDLLGRVGQLNEAEQIIKSMPILPSIVEWTSLLTACRRHGNMELGKHCFTQVQQLNPNLAGGYVLMSYIYLDAHMFKDVYKTQELRKAVAAWKKPGKAHVEVHNMLQEFVVGSTIQPHWNILYAFVKRLKCSMKEQGYVPQLDLVLIPVSRKDSDDAF